MKFKTFLIYSVLLFLALANGLSAQDTNGLQVMQKTELSSFNENIKDDYSKFFVQEIAEKSFDNMTATFDDVSIVFQDDRIEFFNESNDEFFYLIFENIADSSVRGVAKISESKEAISNKAMAEVLGVSEMTKISYESIVYPKAIDGEDLSISIVNGELYFSCVASTPIEFRLFNLDSTPSSMGTMPIRKFGKNMKIHTSNAIVSSKSNNRNVFSIMSQLDKSREFNEFSISMR